MKIITCSPIKGVQSGVTIDVTEKEGNWFVQHGYARKPRQKTSQLLNTSPPRDSDPTLAENREAPDADEPGGIVSPPKGSETSDSGASSSS